MTLHRLIAERLPWPSIKDCSNRRHLRLEWRVIVQGGPELVARTPHPLEDGAAALAAITNTLPGDLVTMRQVETGQRGHKPPHEDQPTEARP